MKTPHPSRTVSFHRPAFSLVELLAVMAILSILLVVGSGMGAGGRAAGRFNAQVAQVSGLIEQARQYAIANNTYVWVAFHEGTPGSGHADKVGVALIASTDGTNPVGWQGRFDVPADGLEMVSRVTWLDGAALAASDSLAAGMVNASRPGETGQPLLGALTFAVPSGGGAGRLDFSQVAVFTPRGEAAVGPSPVAFADIGLRPTRSAGAADPNGAIIQMSGLTGVQRVYRQ